MNDAPIIENQGKIYDAGWEALDAREQAYRDALGDGLEIVFGEGAETLKAIADGLNAHNVHGPKGQRWTEDLIESELQRVAG